MEERKLKHFLCLSPLGYEFLFHFMLCVISCVPAFGTFHNKSLDHIFCRVGRNGKVLFIKSQDTPQKLTTLHCFLARFQHARNFNSHLSLCLKKPPIWLWLNRIWDWSNQCFPFSESSSPIITCGVGTGLCLHLNSNHLLLAGKLCLVLRFPCFFAQ